MERIDPIGASSESDSFPSSSAQAIPTDLRSVEKSDVHQRCVIDTSEVMYPVSCSMQMEQVPALQDSSKQKRCARFNLRKSLAWDSSFFTGEGFLDAEELAIMNSAYQKAEAHGFPIIRENTKNSFESSSAFNRDSWTIESNEHDILESVRASIQKSYNDEARPVKPSRTTNVARKFSDQAPRKVRSSSAKMVKPPIASRKTDLIGKERTENSKDIDRANMVCIGNGCNKQSIKASRASSRIMETRNKRISNNLFRKTNGTVVSGNCSGVSKNIVVHQESCVVAPQSSSSKISPGSPALPRMILAASHSSSTGSKRTLDQKSRTSQVIATKKIDFWNKSMNPIQSSTTKSPVMISKSKKGYRGANNRQAYLNSVPKLSNVSPNSSIESTLSLSSSSSMPTKSTNRSFDAWSSSDSNFSHKSGSQTVHFGGPYGSMDQEGNFVKSSNPCVKTSLEVSLSEMSSTIDDCRTPGNNSEMKGFKLSGLRMPRPKIGYFDAVSSMGTSKCTVEAGNVSGIITPGTNNITLLENKDSLPQIANPQLPTSTIKTEASAPLRPSTSSPQTSRVNHLVECYGNSGSSSQKSSINNKSGIVTPGIGGEDLNISQHLKSLDVKGMDEIDLCSKPVEASNIIPNATGCICEGICDTDNQFRQTCRVLVEKLSRGKFSESEVENSSRCSVKAYEKVNLESEDHKATNLEQLEKIPSSLRLSLSDENVLEASEKLKSLLRRVEFQNSSASPACTPVSFDVLPRAPLVESNCNRHRLFDSRMDSANALVAIVRPQGKASH